MVVFRTKKRATTVAYRFYQVFKQKVYNNYSAL